MSLIKTAAVQLFGLFVDDGIFALAVLGWIVICALALPRLGLPPGLRGPLLALGLAATLAVSALRAARR